MQQQRKIIGLTGNIACGKTTVGKMLFEMGLPVIDADNVGREVTEPGSLTLKKIVEQFGKQLVDERGHLNRAALRTLVFNNAEKKKKLEEILHPAIRKRTEELIEGCFMIGKTTVIYEAALLVETSKYKELDSLIVVTCDPKTQVDRLLARDKTLTADLARKIIASQMPQSEKCKHATWVIENDGTPEELLTKMQNWFKKNLGK